MAYLYAAEPPWIPLAMIRPFHCAMSIIFIYVLTKMKFETVISAYLFSFGISYFLYYISVFMISFVVSPLVSGEYPIDSPVNNNKLLYPLLFIIISVLQLLLSYLIFRIRRFRNGFPFLSERYAVVVALIAAGTVLVLVTRVKVFYEVFDLTVIPLFFAGILIAGSGIFIWVRRGIKMFYRKKMKEHSIIVLEQEIAEKDREIQRLIEQNDAIRIANHKATHRLAALERSVAKQAEKILSGNYSMEISEELSVTLEDIKRLAADYQGDVDGVKKEKLLPSTKLKMLDDLFAYFSEQCAKNKIDFNLKISGSIPYMVEHVIPQSKLETMIGDHLGDALIAVNASDNSFRSILAVLGIAGDCYEFTVFDSGIPFESDTLMRLGTERVTTHSDTGGSGIGFMTTFETMRKCGASLVIAEKKPSNADYSKSVTIRFDGKNEYVIETHRPNAFSGQCDRYTVIGYGEDQ